MFFLGVFCSNSSPCDLVLQTPSGLPGSSESKSSDDYILVSKEEEEGGGNRASGRSQSLRAHKGMSGKTEILPRSSLVFSDPLMGSTSVSSSNLSSSPDDDSSSNSRDSDFTIVSPLDIKVLSLGASRP